METFTHNGVTLTVRKETIRDAVEQQGIQAELSAQRPDDMFMLHYRYSQFVTTTSVTKGELGFEIPLVSSGADALLAGLDAFLNADPELFHEWQEAYRKANDPKATTAQAKESVTS